MSFSKLGHPKSFQIFCEKILLTSTRANRISINNFHLLKTKKVSPFIVNGFSYGSWSNSFNNYRKFYRGFIISSALVTAFTLSHFLKVGGIHVFLDNKVVDAVKLSNEVPPDSAKEETKESNSLDPFQEFIKNELPKKVPYLIIGAGTSAHAASRAIKIHEPQARILLVGDEIYPPYMRPPLSKEIWYNEEKFPTRALLFKQWNGKYRSIFYEHDDYYCPVEELYIRKNGGVSLARGLKVVAVDPKAQVAYFENGGEIEYEKCLIATGGRPRNLEIFENAPEKTKEKITVFRSIEDFKKVLEIISSENRIAVVGGGFLGSELSCALARKGATAGVKVVQLMSEPGCVARVLPEYLSQWTTEKVKQEGVHVINNTSVKDIQIVDDKVELLLTSQNETLKVDHVIVAIGIEPNVEIANRSGLETCTELGGFCVNSELQARKNLWVAGDAACFYDPQLGRRRVEHHDHAVVSGKLAGENMTGAGKTYEHQSMFWSDLGPEVGFEAIGIVDSTLPTIAVFAKSVAKDSPKAAEAINNDNAIKEISQTTPPVDADDKKAEDFDKGIVFYMKGNTIVGILLWNVFNKMSVARKILKLGREYDDLTEVAKLFNLYEAD